jgi:hypothetical protein
MLFNGHARPYNEPRYMPPRVTRFGTPFYQEVPPPRYVRPRVTHFGAPSYQVLPAPSYTPPPVTPFYQAFPRRASHQAICRPR